MGEEEILTVQLIVIEKEPPIKLEEKKDWFMIMNLGIGFYFGGILDLEEESIRHVTCTIQIISEYKDPKHRH